MEQSGLETLVIGANSEFVKKDKPGVIEYDICRNNGNIKKLIFEKGIIETGGAAFMGCYNLASITFPEEGLTTISHDSFRACTSLCSVIIPEGVTTIDVRAFDDCTSLSSIVIPSSVTEIGHQAFQGCESLTDVVIPEGVIKIYWNAFAGCKNLKSITLPKSLTDFDGSAFAGTCLPPIISNGRLISWQNAVGEISIPASIIEIGVSFSSKSALNPSRLYQSSNHPSLSSASHSSEISLQPRVFAS